ncbi:hypothetical protein HMPREF9303_1328 [Prevotella denticola CRIS 18C-A]|uniref:Uncharacterized protein n=1 Tax=Prevotella denticola CRIS 18C-A TaxID=944557 RepID=F0H795_9BACT|nr:hypothetical protein HMPREF9303_1328 [Prevotella denticola CRIS 18C-A]
MFYGAAVRMRRFRVNLFKKAVVLFVSYKKCRTFAGRKL